jgi:hypothetical protein
MSWNLFVATIIGLAFLVGFIIGCAWDSVERWWDHGRKEK